MVACLGLRERPLGSNRGPQINDWRRELGFRRPVPWCAIFCSVKSKEGKVHQPQVWSGRARDFVVGGRSWKLSDVIYRRYTPQPGDYRVKTRRGGNHVDVFVSWDDAQRRGWLVGGNVSHRVKLREITLRRMMVDGTTHITEVDGFHRYRAERQLSEMLPERVSASDSEAEPAAASED
jgi:hypothetical protein